MSLDESVFKGTDNNYDGITVELNEVGVKKVKEHFVKVRISYECKNFGSGKVLGLKINERKVVVRMFCGNKLN